MAGRFSNVDGIPFAMPVSTTGSPALMAAFPVDAGAAQALLPGQELHAYRLWRRGLLVVTVVDYQNTTIGRYIELMIGVVVTRGRRAALPLVPGALQAAFGTGVYIYDLPVSTEISVKGGLGIWGMPKRRANLDFVVGDDTVSSQYDLDGRLVMRIDIPRPPSTPLPMRMNSTGYGEFRGLLTKSYLHFHGRAGISFRPGSAARLLLGDHPRADPLRQLGIDPNPLFTGFVPAAAGVLDDHIETWFLTADKPPGDPALGLDEVVGLGLSQEWLTPPNRGLSDLLLRELSPAEAVGARPPAAASAADGSSARPVR